MRSGVFMLYVLAIAPIAAPAAADDAACLKCHSPIRAKLESKVKHGAVEAGCETCHVNHRQGVTEEQRENHYLTERPPGLCLACHDGKDPKLVATHRNQPFTAARCTRCHDPHASDGPKLLPAAQHPPFMDRQCDTCHQAPVKGKISFNAASVSELCYMCHDEKQKRVTSAKFRHTLLATDANSCIDCHDPHAGKGNAFLKKTPPALCNDCHADLTAGKRFLHEPVGVSCTLCHDAHSSPNSKNLHASVNDLCLGCHSSNAMKIVSGPDAVQLWGGRVKLKPRQFQELRWLQIDPDGKGGHPFPKHPVFRAAVEGKSEINCIACHKPHAGDGGRRRFVTEKENETLLCVRCH